LGLLRRVGIGLYPPPRTGDLRHFPKGRKLCAIGGVARGRLVSAMARLDSGGRFCGFVSGLKIPFPGNRDRRAQRPGSNVALLRGKAKHLVLTRPFCGHVAEASHTQSVRELAPDGRLDEIGCQERE
jgi:hypothetical protein